MNWALLLTEIVTVNSFPSYVGHCFIRLNTRNNVSLQGLAGTVKMATLASFLV